MPSKTPAPSRYVAYCRVSTKKGEQLDSLEQQREFFQGYAEKIGVELLGIYADEGKTGTRMKGRAQLLRLLADAQENMFDVVLIKDISRLARNTVDFLTVIRQLKAIGITVVFINSDQSSSESSEFMLTLLSAVAQEESANASKRTKFGKKMNAEKGKVPNQIYGYNKTIGDLFNLEINQEEAEVVRRIFDMYLYDRIGCAAIARLLNEEGLKTKRGADWSQVAIGRLLKHEIYIGKIVNGKQEVEDFLTSKRLEKDKSEWIITRRPDLAIIEEEPFYQAQHLLAQRSEEFKRNHKKKSEKHIFSTMIKCAECGRFFIRVTRPYANGEYYWSCSTRNYQGANACPNATRIIESELTEAVKRYITSLLQDRDRLLSAPTPTAPAGDKSLESIKEELSCLHSKKAKQIEMYELDIINISELQSRTKLLNAEISRLEQSISNSMDSASISSSNKKLERIIYKLQTDFTSFNITRDTIREIIEVISVDIHGAVDIYTYST